ncbi:hypothetical protein J6590_005310 [Homalodisca vitripennis]|nr:hypothetical protein J6590_005310 [Homalodisca vitripennis]
MSHQYHSVKLTSYHRPAAQSQLSLHNTVGARTRPYNYTSTLAGECAQTGAFTPPTPLPGTLLPPITLLSCVYKVHSAPAIRHAPQPAAGSRPLLDTSNMVSTEYDYHNCTSVFKL